jgi:hypothetical protein
MPIAQAKAAAHCHTQGDRVKVGFSCLLLFFDQKISYSIAKRYSTPENIVDPFGGAKRSTELTRKSQAFKAE